MSFPFSARLYRLMEQVDPQLREVLIAMMEELGKMVTKEEFKELRDAVHQLSERVRELAEAQRRTEERLNELAEAQANTEKRVSRLEEAVEKLAEAQRRTEERLNQLAEAQKRTEERLNQLAEVQKRTEERLNQLAEAQRRTEERINQLAEAQRRTEEELRKLIGEHRKTREQLGGLTHTVGYVLEDRAIKGLPALLEREGIHVEGGLRRDFVEVAKDRYEEVNIFGEARVNGEKVLIVGEGKSHLHKKDVDALIEKGKRIGGRYLRKVVLVAVAYVVHPLVRKYAQEKGVKVYESWQLPLS